MKRAGAVVLIVAGVLAVTAASCARNEAQGEVAELRAVLTDSAWVIDLGSGALAEHYVYVFKEDGSYGNQLVSDYDCPPVTGQWTLSVREDGKVILRLSGHSGQPDYYCLQELSEIRYDEVTDQLFVSGDSYVGEVPLRHDTSL